MKAMQLTEPKPVSEHPLDCVELPMPTLSEEEILIEVEICGICRTDLHVVEGELKPIHPAIIPGHQVVGKVVEVGKNVSSIKTNDRVGVAWLYSTCGDCEYCSSNKENLCKNAEFTGWSKNGGFAEYIKAPEQFIYKIPEIFQAPQASPLLCAGIIGYRALKISRIKQGERLAFFGFGSAAHIGIQIAQHWDCETYIFTRDEKHRRLAKELGATWVGDTFDPSPREIDSAIIFAPAGEIIPHALKLVKRGGTVASAGIYMSDIPAFDYRECLYYEKQLLSVANNLRIDGEELFEVAAKIPIKPKTEEFPLQLANEALLKLKEDGINGSGILRVR